MVRRSRVGRTPILVTGMPRSGTTWLARLLAAAPRTALTGREPMNPRGRQYALAGTLPGWVRLTEPSKAQERVLKRAYHGTNPWVYSRYGRKQWMAPLPLITPIVKDPFAILSIPAVARVTGAQAVMLYRHPGAALASYRRMGWTPDVEELSPLVDEFLASGETGLVSSVGDSLDEVQAMAWFWNSLYGMALSETRAEQVLVVSHEELASGGESAARTLFQALGLQWSAAASDELHQKAMVSETPDALHNLRRDPATVAEEWRERLTGVEVERLEEATEGVHTWLGRRSLKLSTGERNRQDEGTA